MLDQEGYQHLVLVVDCVVQGTVTELSSRFQINELRLTILTFSFTLSAFCPSKCFFTASKSPRARAVTMFSWNLDYAI